MPYRHSAITIMEEYKPSLFVKLKRLWWRFLSWQSHPLRRPQCWACKQTFKPMRRRPIWYDTTCVDVEDCRTARRVGEAVHKTTHYQDMPGQLMPRK